MGTAARTTLPKKRYDLASTPVSGPLLLLKEVDWQRWFNPVEERANVNWVALRQILWCNYLV